MSLGQQIKRARKSLGISQQAVADKFGITRAAVAQWELDQTRPDQGRLVALADVLQTSVGEMLEDGQPHTAREPLPGAPISDAELAELRRAWSLLVPGERAEILSDIQRRAAHNQSVLDMKHQTATPRAEYSPAGESFPAVERRRGAVWFGFPDRRQKATNNEK